MAIDFTKPTALYKQIVDHLRLQIESGVLKPGDQLESQHELAKSYGVSLITVKKALFELINEGFLYSRAGKGTYVAEKKTKLKLSEDVTIGIVLRNLESPFFSRILESVEQTATKLGFNLMVSTSLNSPEKEEAQIQHYLELGVNGLIIAIATSIFQPPKWVNELHHKNFPYYIISYLKDGRINHIGTDQKYGGYIATKHLAELGYSSIGYINGEKGNPLGEARKEGYVQALKEYNLPYEEKFVFRMRKRGDLQDYDSGYIIGQNIFSLKEKPRAMFAYNDLAALGFERAILQGGMKIPDDMAIVGFDNIKRSRVAPVPLTTVHQHTNNIGKLAVEMILNMIKERPFKPRIILKPDLVIRDSCGAKELGP